MRCICGSANLVETCLCTLEFGFGGDEIGLGLLDLSDGDSLSLDEVAQAVAVLGREFQQYLGAIVVRICGAQIRGFENGKRPNSTGCPS